MKIRPLFDRVILTVENDDGPIEKSKSGILLIVGEDEKKDRKTIGDVYAVGDGKYLEDGTRQEPEVKVGDQVLFAKSAAQLIKLDDQNFYFIKEEDIFGVL